MQNNYRVCQRKNVSPDEGKLFSVHAGTQSQTGVLSKWRHNKTEPKRDTYKHCWQNNLKNNQNNSFARMDTDQNYSFTAGQCKVLMINAK